MENGSIFTHCYDLDLQAWKQIIEIWEEPKYRVDQILLGLYKKLWLIPTENKSFWTNIPLSLREKLSAHYSKNPIKCEKVVFSGDNKTIKGLFILGDGYPIEAVLMQMGSDKEDKPLYTLCLSSQSGCPLNCAFCATGKLGFFRNLTCGEIIAQWVFFSRFLLEHNAGRITHIVYMGMGEPLLNTQEVFKSLSIVTHPKMINLAQRRITISTVGIPNQIKKFIDLGTQINLAISLHAATDDIRNEIIPMNKKHPISAIIEVAHEYCVKTKRRITFEYALIDKVNDSNEQAMILSQLLNGLLCHVNLITLNPSSNTSFYPASDKKARIFQSILQKNGIPCTIRGRWGIDINAGCGQLAAQY